MTTPTVASIPDGSDALAGCFLAANYHGGMMTALYALASAGNLELYPGEGPARIRSELGEAIAAAEDQGYDDEAEELRALEEWVANHDDDGEWSDLPPARY
jgi:hypothetical protein